MYVYKLLYSTTWWFDKMSHVNGTLLTFFSKQHIYGIMNLLYTHSEQTLNVQFNTSEDELLWKLSCYEVLLRNWMNNYMSCRVTVKCALPVKTNYTEKHTYMLYPTLALFIMRTFQMIYIHNAWRRCI